MAARSRRSPLLMCSQAFSSPLSVETDPPGLNVLSHATRATDRRDVGITFREYSKHRRDRNIETSITRVPLRIARNIDCESISAEYRLLVH